MLPGPTTYERASPRVTCCIVSAARKKKITGIEEDQPEFPVRSMTGPFNTGAAMAAQLRRQVVEAGIGAHVSVTVGRVDHDRQRVNVHQRPGAPPRGTPRRSGRCWVRSTIRRSTGRYIAERNRPPRPSYRDESARDREGDEAEWRCWRSEALFSLMPTSSRHDVENVSIALYPTNQRKIDTISRRRLVEPRRDTAQTAQSLQLYLLTLVGRVDDLALLVHKED